MKLINQDTKIATLIKEHPDALDAIISITPKFKKLRNPVLGKFMASRTSINMASKVGSCTVNDFYAKLKPLGFIVDTKTIAEDKIEKSERPEYLRQYKPGTLVELDVRDIIESGKDPFTLITRTIKQLQTGQVLKLINSFEPVPLIQLLEKQGFETYIETISESLVHTFFYKKNESIINDEDRTTSTEGWDERIQRYSGKTDIIDVRHLEMPLPMLTILEALDKLPAEKALYVCHKRIPVFLLPELAQRELDYRIREVNEGEVHLLIYKP